MPGFGGGGFGKDPFGEWPWSRQVLYDFLPAIYRDQDQYNDHALEKWTDSLRYSFDEIADRITEWEDLRKPLSVRTQYDETVQVKLGKVQISATPIEQRGVDGVIDSARNFHAPSARFKPADVGKQLTISESAVAVNNRTFKVASIVNTTTVRCDPPLLTDAGPLRWQMQGRATRPAGILPVEIRGGDAGLIKPGWTLFDGSSEFTVESRQRFYPDQTQAKSLTLREGKEGVVLPDGRFQAEVPFSQTDVGRPFTVSGSTQPHNNSKVEIFFVDEADPSILQFHRPLLLAGTSPDSGVAYTLRVGQTGVEVAHVLQGPSSPLLVSVSGRTITVALQTDVDGAPESTAAQVAAAVNATFLSSELVEASFTGTGADIVSLYNATPIPGSRLLPDQGPLVWALLPFPQVFLRASAPPRGVVEQEGVDLEFTSTPGVLNSTTASFTANDVGKTIFVRGSLLGNSGSYLVTTVNNVNEVVVSYTAWTAETDLTWELRTLTSIGDFTEVSLNAPSLIQYLAQDFGIEIDTRESADRQRSWVENVTQWIDLKGTDKAYSILGAISGFDVEVSALYRVSTQTAAPLSSTNVFFVVDESRNGFKGRLTLNSSTGRVQLTSPTALFISADEGVSIRLSNCADATNNKTYSVETFIDGYTVEFASFDTAITPDYGIAGTFTDPTIQCTVGRVYTDLVPYRPRFDEVNVELMQSIVGVDNFKIDGFCGSEDFVNHLELEITAVTPTASLGAPIFYTATLQGVLLPGPVYTSAGVVTYPGRWRITDSLGQIFYVESVPVQTAPGPPSVHTLQVFASVVPALGTCTLEYLCAIQDSCDYCRASAILATIEEGTILDEVGIAVEKVLERVIDRLINEVKPIHVQLLPRFRRTVSTSLNITATITGALEIYEVLEASLLLAASVETFPVPMETEGDELLETEDSEDIHLQ